ncbi:hypothetical protein [Chamaesiphon sp.]|uniref:hypothetical protein n=1 Tax=Chamaesiphon sp. TaxID=2814140 RepID=UPI003593EC2F
MSKQWWQLSSLVMSVLVVAGCSKNTSQITASNSPSPALAAPQDVWMSQFEQLNGTPYLYAPIYVAEQERKSILKQIKSGSYDNRKGYAEIDIRNYMFVHRDNLSATKLFTNNNSRIIELEQIGEPASGKKLSTSMNQSSLKTVKTLWYLRVVADTNGDKLLNELDRKQIGLSDAVGANYAEVIKDIDKILLVYPKGRYQRLVFYTSANRHFVADVDLLKRQARIEQLPALK